METIVIVGDAHSNSTLGLCPRGVELEEGRTHTPTDTQKWLWDCWLEFCDFVPNRGVTSFFNGDWVDGDIRFRTHQVISRNPGDIIDMGIDNALPLVDKSDRVFFLKGTRSHAGKSAWLETQVAKDFDNTVMNEYDKPVWERFYGEFGGVVFDIKHFGSLGYRPWTLPNSLNAMAVEIELNASKSGERLPDLVVRNHRHRHADSGDNYRTRVIANYAWQGMTEYANDITNTPPDIGGLIVNCEGGEYELIKKHYPVRPRKLWTIPFGKKTLMGIFQKK